MAQGILVIKKLYSSLSNIDINDYIPSMLIVQASKVKSSIRVELLILIPASSEQFKMPDQPTQPSLSRVTWYICMFRVQGKTSQGRQRYVDVLYLFTVLTLILIVHIGMFCLYQLSEAMDWTLFVGQNGRAT